MGWHQDWIGDPKVMAERGEQRRKGVQGGLGAGSATRDQGLNERILLTQWGDQAGLILIS